MHEQQRQAACGAAPVRGISGLYIVTVSFSKLQAQAQEKKDQGAQACFALRARGIPSAQLVVLAVPASGYVRCIVRAQTGNKKIRKHKAPLERAREGQHAYFFTGFWQWLALKARPGYAGTSADAAGLVADGIAADRQKCCNFKAFNVVRDQGVHNCCLCEKHKGSAAINFFC